MYKSTIMIGLVFALTASSVLAAYPDCAVGTWPNTGTSTCDPCLANCTNCTDGTTCATCNATYFWDDTGKTCAKCV